MFDKVEQLFPNIKKIYEIISNIPISSCYIERSFAIEGVIHNKYRNRLNIDTINNILRLKFKYLSDKRKQIDLFGAIQNEVEYNNEESDEVCDGSCDENEGEEDEEGIEIEEEDNEIPYY